MDILSEALTTYSMIEQQKVAAITAQAQQLQQLIVAQLGRLQMQELTFLQRQQQTLDTVRTHLAKDARSLLHTAEFLAFVQDFWSSRQTVEPDALGLLQVASDPTNWQLHQLSTPVRLTGIEALEEDAVDKDAGAYTSYTLAMLLEVGSWQQALALPVAIVTPTPPRYQDAPHRWNHWQAIVACLDAAHPSIPFAVNGPTAASLQRQLLTQELSYLITYTSELFTLSRFAAQLRLLQNLVGQHAPSST